MLMSEKRWFASGFAITFTNLLYEIFKIFRFETDRATVFSLA